MIIFKLAKELGVSSNEVLNAMRDVGIVAPDNHFCAISDEHADVMRRYFVRQALGFGVGGFGSGGFGSGVEDGESRSGVTQLSNGNDSTSTDSVSAGKETEKTAPIIVRRAAGTVKESPAIRRANDKFSIPDSIFGTSVKERKSS